MNYSHEQLWVRWLNSKHWRHFVGEGGGARLIHSETFRQFNTARRYALTTYKSYRQPGLFRDVKTFCMFIGHAKSGGTLLGSLLDAHPNAILADEADALHYVGANFRRDQIFHILLKGSQREAMKGRVTARRLTPYSLAVPDQWQGNYQELHVIGDSKAGPSTNRLAAEPHLLAQLQQVLGRVEARFIHVVRNPYDPISVMMVRGKRPFSNAIDHYFSYCHTLSRLRQQLHSNQLITIHYEDFVRQPHTHLMALCQFLGLTAEDDYLDACAAILYPSPERQRHLAAWDDHWIAVVQDQLQQFDFLAGYDYEN